jgi:hypothetical protein
MNRTLARSALVISITFLVALVSTTTAQTARADGPTKPAKTTAKAPSKPASKPAPKPVAPQKVPRNIGAKDETAKPIEAPKGEGTGSREEKAGKVDGRKWRPRRRG